MLPKYKAKGGLQANEWEYDFFKKRKQTNLDMSPKINVYNHE